MLFLRLAERVERLIQGSPPVDEANDALDEITILAAKLYVKCATEGRSGFDARVAKWKPTRTVVIEGRRVDKPEVKPFEQKRLWLCMWAHISGKVACENPDRVSSSTDRADIVWTPDDSFAPFIRKADGSVKSIKKHSRFKGAQDLSRWRQTAEWHVDVLRVLAEFYETGSNAKVPYRPAEWFKSKFGIPAPRLQSAKRREQLAAIDIGIKRPRYHYSVPDAIRLWPDDGIYLPDSDD